MLKPHKTRDATILSSHKVYNAYKKCGLRGFIKKNITFVYQNIIINNNNGIY